MADHPVLFVQLDVTDSTLTSQARLLAAALDVEDHFKANNKTGLVLLINAQDHTLLETVTKQNSADEIIAKSKPISPPHNLSRMGLHPNRAGLTVHPVLVHQGAHPR